MWYLRCKISKAYQTAAAATPTSTRRTMILIERRVRRGLQHMHSCCSTCTSTHCCLCWRPDAEKWIKTLMITNVTHDQHHTSPAPRKPFPDAASHQPPHLPPAKPPSPPLLRPRCTARHSHILSQSHVVTVTRRACRQRDHKLTVAAEGTCRRCGVTAHAKGR